MHKDIMGRLIEFLPQFQTHRLALTYDMRPENHVMALQRVVDMVRRRSPELDAFIEKVRGLIINSREKESWDEPPSRVVAEHVAFTPDDRVILEVLHLALRRTRHHSANPYTGVVTAIIKRVGLYTQSVVDHVCLRQFLIEVREMAPWRDMISRRRELNLDLMPDEESQRVKDQNALVKKSLSLRSSSRSRTKVNAPLAQRIFIPATLSSIYGMILGICRSMWLTMPVLKSWTMVCP